VQREIVSGAAKKNVGLLLDAYHLARSGAPGRGFADVPADDIFCFQYSDLSPSPVTGVKRPTDRLPPRQGTGRGPDVPGLPPHKNYTRDLSYAAPNPHLSARPPPPARRA